MDKISIFNILSVVSTNLIVAHCHDSRPLKVYKASRYKFLCGSISYVSTMVMQYPINNEC